MSLPKIRDCPFCGSAAQLSQFGEIMRIDCINEDCHIKPGTRAGSKNQRQVIEMWNWRAR